MARAKPPAGTLLDPSHPSLAGAAACWLLSEGKGNAAVDSLGRRSSSAFVGAPTWGVGPMGPTLGGFSTSNYAALDRPQVLGSIYPFWLAVLASSTSATLGYTLNQGSGSGGNCSIGLSWNGSPNNGTVAGQACYVLRDGVGGGSFSPQFTDSTINDGKPHVLMGVSYAPSDHRIYLDGRQRATDATTLGACDGSMLTLGAFRRNATLTAAFGGQAIACSLGNTLVPDPAALARAWLAGDFGAARVATPCRYLAGPVAPVASKYPAILLSCM